MHHRKNCDAISHLAFRLENFRFSCKAQYAIRVSPGVHSNARRFFFVALPNASPSPRGKSGAPLRFPNIGISVRPFFQCLELYQNRRTEIKRGSRFSTENRQCMHIIRTKESNAMHIFRTKFPSMHRMRRLREPVKIHRRR